MARLKTIKIDDRTREIRDDANIIDVVPSEVTSITTRDGTLIPRSEFARVRVPEGFETNLSAINKGACRHVCVSMTTATGRHRPSDGEPEVPRC